MTRVDNDLLRRAVAWCSAAGRSATEEEARAALAPLGWDELLMVRALLADPPPARPLGPWALVDVARGVDPALASEREEQGRYPPLATAQVAAPRTGAPAGARATGKGTRSAGPIIRRSRDRIDPASSQPPSSPIVDELFASEGRAVLERLVREHGARRARLVGALASGWRTADGGLPGEDDLTRLLDAHGLARGFERRERDEILHALRAAAGLRSAAAASLALTPRAFDESLARLGATQDAESIREAHRAELRRRATLSERVRLLVAEAERLADLGILPEVEADLRARLPDHVRALRASGAAPLLPALARSLAAPPREVAALAVRLGVDIAERPTPSSRARDRPRAGPERPPGAQGTRTRRESTQRPHGGPRARGPAPKRG